MKPPLSPLPNLFPGVRPPQPIREFLIALLLLLVLGLSLAATVWVVLDSHRGRREHIRHMLRCR